MTFEEKINRLENIIQQLENESLGLEESVKLYEEAKVLSKELNEELKSSMDKLSFIVEDGEVKEFDNEISEKEI